MTTSEEIVGREFTIVMRGYERQEVDEHLRRVAGELDRLRARTAELERELQAARAAQAPAEPQPADQFRALGEETTRILVAAESSAREMREKAERQAEAEVAAAERAARERVDAASEHAAQLVAEAEGRRAQVEAEIRRLDGVRTGLVDQLRLAVTATTDVVAGLVTTEEEGDAPAPGAERASGLPAALTEPDDDPDPEPDEAPGAAGAHDASPEPAATTAEEPAAEPSPPAEPEPSPAAAPEPVAEHDPAPATDTAAAEVHHGAAPGAVEAALSEASVAAGGEPAAPVELPEGVEPGMLRERSLAGIRPGMLRRLRRGLQELQNGVLESIRTRSGDDVERLLPGAAGATALVDVARVFVDAGYRAGRADAPVLTGGDQLTDPPTDGGRVTAAAEALANELVDELRTTLTPSLRAGLEAGEPDASLSERVGEVFRDLKGPVVELVVDRQLTGVYGRATLDGWAAAGHRAVGWVLGEETRCPEGACRGNEAEGAVELGSDFPSGHAVPPVHDGCTCALAPA